MGKNNKPTSPELIATIRVLRKNGYTYDQIKEHVGVGKGTCVKYGKDVQVLPEELRIDPFDETRGNLDFRAAKLHERDDYKSKQKLKDFWIENHVEGKRFEGPLDLYSIEELIDICKEPTNYQSPLNPDDWYDYYIAPMMFRGESTTLSRTQREINDFLDEHQHAMVQVFRKMGKTVLVIGRLTYAICENPEENFAVQSEIIDRSRDRVMAVRSHLMSNPLLIADYGYLPHDKLYHNTKALWKAGEFVIKRDTIQTDPSLKALSWKDSKMLGGHFKGVLFDDPWSAKLEENNEQNKEKWFRWYDSTLVGSLEEDSWQHIVCTRKGLYDIYRELDDRGMFATFNRPAIIDYPSEIEYIKENKKIVDVKFSDDGKISDDCNGRFSMRFFLMQKVQMSAEAWEMEYQLEPMPMKGRMFQWDNMEFYELPDLCKIKPGIIDANIRVIGAMDMAFGKSESAHYTALAILGAIRNDIYLIQAYIKKNTSKLDKAKMIDRAKEDYPSMRKVFIEADLQQSAYIDELKQLTSSVKIEGVLSRHEQNILKKEESGNLTAKAVRIYSQLDEVVESGRFHIREDMRHFDELKKEFKEFPKSKYDDLIDAIGLGVSNLKKHRGTIWGLSG